MSQCQPARARWTDSPQTYRIRVQGTLENDWSDRFGGLVVENLPNGETLLTGQVRDQTALYGILMRLRDLCLPLITLERLESDAAETEDS